MLLCVAGGGSSGFNRDRSREGARCSTQSIFIKNNANQQIMVEERCSMTSAAVNVSPGLVTTQDTVCLDPRARRSAHNKYNENNLTSRGKVIVVRGEDSPAEKSDNEETCATTTTFKSNVVNGKRSTNTILVRYKPSKLLSQSSDDFKGELGIKNDGTQQASLSSASSVSSNESASSGKKDKASISAWAQIMELEGYRSPAIGLDNAPKRNGENSKDVESSDNLTVESSDDPSCFPKGNSNDCYPKSSFHDACYYYSDKAGESEKLKSSTYLNRNFDSDLLKHNISFSSTSQMPDVVFDNNGIYKPRNQYNSCSPKEENCDSSQYHSAPSSNCSDKISDDSLTLPCPSLSDKNHIRIAQKIKSPMYRSESSRVPKTALQEKSKSRRKTLPDGNLQLTDDSYQVNKTVNKKKLNTEIDPNASWGRYNSKAMRDSVRKVAQKYAEVYLRRQSQSKLDALPEAKGVQLTRYVSPYTHQNHQHCSPKFLGYLNNSCSRMPSAPSHLHEVTAGGSAIAEPLLSNRRKLHLLAATSTHHDHSIPPKTYGRYSAHKKTSIKSSDNIDRETKLDSSSAACFQEKHYAESLSSNSDRCSSVSSHANNSSGESELFCDKSTVNYISKLKIDYPMCKECMKRNSKFAYHSESSKHSKHDSNLKAIKNEENKYSSAYIRDIKSKLCSNCAQSADSGPPSKHSASRSRYSKSNPLFLSSSSLYLPVTNLRKINGIDPSMHNHSHFSNNDNVGEVNSSSKRCTMLTAREMTELVHGSKSGKLNDEKLPHVGVTSKVTNWIQRQKDKRKPVFFIGDSPTFFSENYREGEACDKIANRKSKRSLSLSNVREDEISTNSKGIRDSSLNLSSVRLNPSIDDKDHDRKNLYIKRASSSCSNRGSVRRKIRQGSPVTEEKETVAKNFDDHMNEVDGCIASWKKRQNNNVQNIYDSNHPAKNIRTDNSKKDLTSNITSIVTAQSDSEYACFLNNELDSKRYSHSDIHDSVKENEDISRITDTSASNDYGFLSLGDSNQNFGSLVENKNERSSFSKRLLNIKQLTRALSLHSLKKKTKESENEQPADKSSIDDVAPSTHFSKWARNSKRKVESSKYGSLRKSLSYCELILRDSDISGKSNAQVGSQTEIKSTSKSSARTSVPFTNSICFCSATLRRSISLYAKFPLSRCSEYYVDETKSEFLARLCASRLYRRGGVPPFVRQLRNKRILDKMKDGGASSSVYQKHLHPLDIPKHPEQIPVIVLPNFTGSDANILRKRAASTSDYSPKSKAIQRPVSVADYLTLENSPCTKVPQDGQNDLTRTASDTTSSEEQQKNLTSLDQIWRANPVKLCRVHSRLLMCRHKGRYRLRRSISQPVELEMTGSVHNLRDSTHGSADHENFQKGSLSSDDEASSESDIYHSYCCSPTRRSNTCWELSGDGTMYAEALWDHETIDPEELPFQAGDIIEVTDTSDQDWWWGTKDGHGGWFPSAFVRLYVSQRTPSLHFNGQQSDGIQIPYSPCKVSMNNLSCEQVRANIVQEIVATERDYVKHLKDVVEGYLKQVHRRPDMFSKERIETVFGNIKEIYTFQSQFLKQLEECLDKDSSHLSEIGNCFLNHKEEFKMYSQYCNNHPLAVSELQELYCDSQYIHFFEACRLLQEMIDISLDGFLLTPIQRICKYPLQLAELLKFTDANHPDHVPVTNALAAMKEVAELVNERKRRMECLERIAEWQNTIEGWEGPDVLDTSSILIHCGEVTRVSSSWSRDIYLFIFDHQLIYCKKDLLKRHTYAYKGRLNLDNCDIINVEDGKDSQFAVNVKNAWKIYCKDKDKWYLFYAKTSPEKDQWLRAFKAERQRVIDDEKQAFVVTEEAKKSARLAVHNKQKPKRPRAKFTKGRRCHPDVAVTELILDSPSAKARSGSLPSNIHPELAIMAGAKLGPTRKKGSGWFHFGSGKKPKS